MKNQYPSYKHTGTSYLEETLKPIDRKALDSFCKYCMISAGEKKIRIIRATLLQIQDITETPLTKLKLQDIHNFLGLLKQAPLSEWTKNDIKKFLKKFLKWCHKDWSDRYNNFEDIKNVSMQKAFNHEKINESTLITKEELELLLRTAQTLKWKAILTLMFESACRPQELRLLKWSDIKKTDDGADITFFSPKTRLARTIPIQDCVIHLDRWKQEYAFPDVRGEDLVFPSHKRGEILTDNALPKHLKEICMKAGMRLIHPYLFRHTRLTFLYEKFPEQIVKKYAGHSKSSKMPEIYSHISSKSVRDVVLKEIYGVKELTPEQRNTYQKQIDELRDKIQEFAPMFKFLSLPLEEQQKINDKLKQTPESNLIEVFESSIK